MSIIKKNAVKNNIARSPSKEFLIFELGGENYAVDILKVQEIKAYLNLVLTTVTNVPSYILGLTTLNTMIIPIIDLRILYNLKNQAYQEHTVAIIINVEPQPYGIVIDKVVDTASIALDKIESASNLNKIIHNDCIEGVSDYNGKILIILDTEKLNNNFNFEVKTHVS